SAAAAAAEDRDDGFAEHLPDVVLAADRALTVGVAAVEEPSVADECRQAANGYAVRGLHEAAEDAESGEVARIPFGAERVLVHPLVAVSDTAAERDRTRQPVLAQCRLQSHVEDVLPQLHAVVRTASRDVVDDLGRERLAERIERNAHGVAQWVCKHL